MSEILDAIERAVRDYETGPDAMRWTPEGTPTPNVPTPMQPARVEHIEIKVRTSDGREHTYTMTGAEDIEVSMDWGDPDWDPWNPTRLIAPRERGLESFAVKVRYPSGLEQRIRDGEHERGAGG